MSQSHMAEEIKEKRSVKLQLMVATVEMLFGNLLWPTYYYV